MLFWRLVIGCSLTLGFKLLTVQDRDWIEGYVKGEGGWFSALRVAVRAALVPCTV
jgi:hypothetical protein